MDSFPSKSVGYDDMRQLEQLNEESILTNLQARHAAEIPYTYSGNMCLAVNPYKWLPLYGEKVASTYLAASSPQDLPPHVYAIAANAFHAMVRTEKDQSILVSGESGAGKTETTKIILQFLASSAAQQEEHARGHGDIVDRVLQSNPVLEAFGNAQTVRNNNSSRFGKLIQLQFDARQVVGANSITLLLEKSRVVFQSELERSFHVFYQLLSSEESELREVKLKKDIAAFHYLRHSFKNPCFTFEDAKDWSATLHALHVLGVSSEEIQSIKKVLAAILHLGNIAFARVDARDGKCDITNGAQDNVLDQEEKKDEDCDDDIVTHAVEYAAHLLVCAEDDLRKALLSRRLLVGGEWIDVPLTLEQAQDNRDALSKELYSRTFDWLVTKINQSTSASGRVTNTTSVLDIFGFEHFQFNSFEQLCINYANEHLQQRFTKDVFECAQAEYVAEGVPWEMIAYKDNKELLDMFEGRLGVLSLLNEECMLPKGNDTNFVSKLLTHHSASAYLQKPSHKGRKGGGGASGFVVSHYAGNVEYCGDGMMKKNQDTLQQDLLELISGSGSPFLQQLVGSTAIANRAHARRASVVADTVSVRFKTQLQELMKRVSATATHYIRCVKPNEVKSATVFDCASVTEQLRCSGVLEAVRISRAGFPDRVASEDIVMKYGVIGRWQTRRDVEARSAPVTSNGLLHQLSDKLHAATTSSHPWFVGKTKIFFATGVLAALDKMKDRTVSEAAVHVTRSFKAVTKRRQFLRLKKAAIASQAKWRQVLATSSYVKAKRACVKLQACLRGHQARKLLNVLRRFKAAIKIQACFRSYQQRRIFCRCRVACITIQSVVRMFACQKSFRVALAEAREQQLLKNQLVAALETVASQRLQLKEAYALVEALKAQLASTSAFVRPSADVASLELFSETVVEILPSIIASTARESVVCVLEEEDVNPSLPDPQLKSVFEFSAVKPRGSATPVSSSVVPFGELQNRSPKRVQKTPKGEESGLACVTSPIRTCDENVTFGKKSAVSKRLTTLMGRSKVKTAKKLPSNAAHVDLSPSHWPLDENSIPVSELASPDRVLKRDVTMSMEQWVSGDDFSKLGSPGLRIKESMSTPSKTDRSSVIHDIVTTTTRKVTTFVKETVMPLVNTMQIPSLPSSFTGAKPSQGKKENESPAVTSKLGSPVPVKVGIKAPTGRRQANAFSSTLACTVPYEEISYFGDESTFSFKGSIM